MPYSRMGVVGGVLAGIGWCLLPVDRAGLDIPSILALAGWRPGVMPHLGNMAPTLVLAGFAFAILGALNHGFGALQRFFDQIVSRSAPSPAPAAEPIMQEIHRPALEQPEVREIDRGLVRSRPYVLFADGSAEVTTLIGRRRFDKLHDALEFIGEQQRLAG